MEGKVTRGEVLSYPLMTIASVGLLAWAAFASLRQDDLVSPSIYEQIVGAAMLGLGFLLSAAVDTLIRRRSGPTTRRGSQAGEFNSAFIQETVAVLLPPPPDAYPHVPPWELTSARLVGYDNSLALAKLRLDIDRLLREMAFAHHIDVARASAGAVKMAQMLGERGLLPIEIVEPTRQIVAICNRAIHGYDISDELADAVVSAGEDLLARLRQHMEQESSGTVNR